MRSPLAAAYRTGRSAAAGYTRHACSQLAAGIAYRVLFSLVPFVALVLSVLELVLPEETRRDIVDWLFGRTSATEIESAVRKTVVHPGSAVSVGGLVAVAALLWAATGMMASIRIALASLLLLGGFAVSVCVRFLAEAGNDLSDAVGLHGALETPGTLVQIAGSVGLAFLAFLVVYSSATPEHMGFAAIWPGALLGAVAIEVLVEGYAVYLARFSGFHAVYGPLAAVFAFLLLVYLVAAILLFCAELAGVRAGR